MVMRYHFGLGVGHVYASARKPAGYQLLSESERNRGQSNTDTPHEEDLAGEVESTSITGSVSDESGGTNDSGQDAEDGSYDGSADGSDDDEFYAMQETYGLSF
jgi:flagellar hook assembly protein FlgD